MTLNLSNASKVKKNGWHVFSNETEARMIFLLRILSNFVTWLTRTWTSSRWHVIHFNHSSSSRTIFRHHIVRHYYCIKCSEKSTAFPVAEINSVERAIYGFIRFFSVGIHAEFMQTHGFKLVLESCSHVSTPNVLSLQCELCKMQLCIHCKKKNIKSTKVEANK